MILLVATTVARGIFLTHVVDTFPVVKLMKASIGKEVSMVDPIYGKKVQGKLVKVYKKWGNGLLCYVIRVDIEPIWVKKDRILSDGTKHVYYDTGKTGYSKISIQYGQFEKIDFKVIEPAK